MIKRLFLALFLVLVSTGAVVAGENTKTVVLNVPGMSCPVCPITVRKALEKVPGVVKAKADFDSKTATVTFDPDKTSAKKLSEATTNAGYPSTIKN